MHLQKMQFAKVYTIFEKCTQAIVFLNWKQMIFMSVWVVFSECLRAIGGLSGGYLWDISVIHFFIHMWKAGTVYLGKCMCCNRIVREEKWKPSHRVVPLGRWVFVWLTFQAEFVDSSIGDLVWLTHWPTYFGTYDKTCDLCDIWSEWWRDMNWDNFWQFGNFLEIIFLKSHWHWQLQRLVAFEILITIMTIENLNGIFLN